MKLPVELIERLKGGAEGTSVVYLVTATREGRTTLLPSPFTDVVGGEYIFIPDLFALQTKVDLNENHHAALSIATEDGRLPFVFEGTADVVQWGHPGSFKLFGFKAGDVLDHWGDWDEGVEPVIDAVEPAARPSVFAQRGVIIFRPEYSVEVSS